MSKLKFPSAAELRSNPALAHLLQRLNAVKSKEELEREHAQGLHWLNVLKQHPRYVKPEPDYKQDSIEFCLQASSMLASLAEPVGQRPAAAAFQLQAALLVYSHELRRIWLTWMLTRRQTVERQLVKNCVPPFEGKGNTLVAAWKLDEIPFVVFWQEAEQQWYGVGGKTWKRDYFDYWAPLPEYL